MEVEEAGEGFARVAATARLGFLNAHRLAHGSFIFAVADVAFALAVNSLTDSVGVEYHLSLFRSTKLGGEDHGHVSRDPPREALAGGGVRSE